MLVPASQAMVKVVASAAFSRRQAAQPFTTTH